MVGSYLIVFIGGGLGAALRHGVNRVSLAYLGPTFPYGTLFVNIVGGLLMGVLAEIFLAKAAVVRSFGCSSPRGFWAVSQLSRRSVSTRL